MKTKPTQGLSSDVRSFRRRKSTQRLGANNINPDDITTTKTLARLKDHAIRFVIIPFDSFMVFLFGTANNKDELMSLVVAEVSLFAVIGMLGAFICRGTIMAIIYCCLRLYSCS